MYLRYFDSSLPVYTNVTSQCTTVFTVIATCTSNIPLSISLKMMWNNYKNTIAKLGETTEESQPTMFELTEALT